MIETQLKDILENNLNCKQLIVENQSHLHDGHASSPNSGQSHFHVTIISDDFKNMSRVQSHQAVNQLISHLFNQGLHALSITTSSPH
jgi:BolA protein